MLKKFKYLETVENLLKNTNHCLLIPEASGIYVVVYLGNGVPEFIESGIGSKTWPDKNIDISPEKLLAKWVHFKEGDDKIIYIGRANARTLRTTLRNRIRQYILFGQGKSITHYGGRHIWQIARPQDMAIYFKEDDKPSSLEKILLSQFKERHEQKLPFANLRGGGGLNIRKIINSKAFTKGLVLGPDSLHDPSHWERVESFGHKIAEVNGADKEVVSLFAYLHDARRENDGCDPDHGKRAVALLDELIKENLIVLTTKQYQQLSAALRAHNREDAKSDDVTVQTCWDADRLDLWRCGYTPNPDLMYTDYGKSKKMIKYAKKFIPNNNYEP